MVYRPKTNTLYIWQRPNETVKISNLQSKMSIEVKRVRSGNALEDCINPEHIFEITENNGSLKRRVISIPKKMWRGYQIGPLTLSLGINPPRKGSLDVGYTAPPEWKIERRFYNPSPKRMKMYHYFSVADAFYELKTNHGFEMPSSYGCKVNPDR